ncbi:WSC domain-containing protein 1-like [Hyalella azteca]|uniref:WSC domain-containing protein 1-like n=1 Tax=Hyalella azteca TaxID=294128 RepID=A0A8B7PCM2_HYAAZ|nr:WSC domain-containing protein 1-like [Hyalella azteca]
MFMRMQLRRWLLTALQWLTKGSDVQVLHYELLQHNLTAALTSLVTTLGLPADTHRLQCLETHNHVAFRRKTQFLPANLPVFPAGVRDKVDRAIRYVDHLLTERKLPPLPLHLYEFYNRTSSHTIVRVPCEAQASDFDCDVKVDELNTALIRKATLSKRV